MLNFNNKTPNLEQEHLYFTDASYRKDTWGWKYAGIGIYNYETNLELAIQLQWNNLNEERMNNATAELYAIFTTLKMINQLQEEGRVESNKCKILSDSEYSVKTINQYFYSWIR